MKRYARSDWERQKKVSCFFHPGLSIDLRPESSQTLFFQVFIVTLLNSYDTSLFILLWFQQNGLPSLEIQGLVHRRQLTFWRHKSQQKARCLNYMCLPELCRVLTIKAKLLLEHAHLLKWKSIHLFYLTCNRGVC